MAHGTSRHSYLPVESYPFTLPNGIHVNVENGDITKFPADAVVIGEDQQFSGSGGVAKVILKAGGPDYKSAKKEMIARYGPKNAYGRKKLIYWCSAGRCLPFTRVYHAVFSEKHGQQVNSDWKKLVKTLFVHLCDVVESCTRDRHIVTPIMGSGGAGGKIEDSVEAALEGFCSVHAPRYLKDITIVEYDKQKTEKIIAECMKWTERQSMKHGGRNQKRHDSSLNAPNSSQPRSGRNHSSPCSSSCSSLSNAPVSATGTQPKGFDGHLSDRNSSSARSGRGGQRSAQLSSSHSTPRSSAAAGKELDFHREIKSGCLFNTEDENHTSMEGVDEPPRRFNDPVKENRRPETDKKRPEAVNLIRRYELDSDDDEEEGEEGPNLPLKYEENTSSGACKPVKSGNDDLPHLGSGDYSSLFRAVDKPAEDQQPVPSRLHQLQSTSARGRDTPQFDTPSGAPSSRTPTPREQQSQAKTIGAARLGSSEFSSPGDWRRKTGNMPEGKMLVNTNTRMNLEGYANCGVLVIEYSFPNGVQTSEHPNPGQPYKGTFRRAFLPNNEEGQQVLEFLREAFVRRLTFRIVAGAEGEGTVEFADIPHKTRPKGGPPEGYPDNAYLGKVRDLLRDNYGIQ